MTSTEKYSKPKENAKDKVAKIQLDHLLLDVDFFHKPKIKSFKRVCGLLACLWLIECYCQMSRASEGEVDKDTLLDVADEMGLSDKAEEIISYATHEDRQLITKLENGKYTNSRVQKDQVSLATRREKDREKQLRYRDKTVTLPVISPEKNGNPVTDTVTDTEYINNKNSEPIPEVPDEWLDLALSKLEEPKNQPWMNSSIHMMGGHRPMKGYNKLYWRPQDLALVFKEWDQTVPKKLWKSGFLLAQSKVEATLQTGKKLEEIPLMSWFLTFVRKELLETATTQAKHTKFSGGELNG